MNITGEDFIATCRGVYPEGYCKHLIDEFERLQLSGAGYTRQQSEGVLGHRKKDLQVSLNFNGHSVAPFDGKNSTNLFFEGLQTCYDVYRERFSVLSEERIRATAMKMQRTDSGGGYHLWHGEQGAGVYASRVLVYMLYLNTLEPDEGGETEFLYQRKRVRPEENVMLLWPAAFTHAHRGNTVLGDKSKYVVTGWFYYE